MNYNRVILAGRLTRDPELKYLADGTAVTNIDLAVNKIWFDKNKQKKESTVFVRCSVWSKQAETVCQYLKKGSGCLVEGELQAEEWEKDGVKHKTLSVRASKVQFTDSKPATDKPQQDTDNAQEDGNSIPF